MYAMRSCIRGGRRATAEDDRLKTEAVMAEGTWVSALGIEVTGAIFQESETEIPLLDDGDRWEPGRSSKVIS